MEIQELNLNVRGYEIFENRLAPEFVTDRLGNTHAAWYSASESGYTVYYKYRSHLSSEWSDVVTLTPEPLTAEPSALSILTDGIDLPDLPTAYVAWLAGGNLYATTVVSPYTSGLTPTLIDTNVQNFSLTYNGWRGDEARESGAKIVYENMDSSGNPWVYYVASTGDAWSKPFRIDF